METSDKVASKPLVEEIMAVAYEVVADDGMEQAEATAKTEDFLMLARSKFGRVPEDREAQVRSAWIPQLDNWLLRVLRAPSLSLVFDDDRGMTQNEAKARSEAKAEDFLILARSKYRRVPGHIEELVRASSVPQIEYWLPRILTATSLNAVFDEDAGNGHAVNDVPVKSPPLKRTAK